MNKSIIRSVGLVTVGLVIGVFLVSNFVPDVLDNVFAQGDTKIGAEKAPIVMSERAKIVNETLVSVSEAVLPTVVSISVEIENPHGDNQMFREFYKYFGMPEGEEFRSRGSGSGVFITSDGYIVTNSHVVDGAMESGISVTTSDKKTHKAELIGYDPLTDLAVIKIDGDDYPAVHLGNIEDVKVGEMVLAVGNPLGLNSTVTSGIISALGRGNMGLVRQRSQSPYAIEHFIQTDAAINPGNSGGGLFDLNGSLVGINTAIATAGTGGYIGYGFAIPINIVRSVVTDLMEDGKINRGYIGVQVRSIDEIEAKSLELDKVSGVLVERIVEDSPAQKAKLEVRDVILEVNGEEVSTVDELKSRILPFRSGDEVKLRIWRDGKSITKTIILEEPEDTRDVAVAGEKLEENDTKDDEPFEFKDLGFSVKPITQKIKDEYDIDYGVIITKVKRYSPADERGMAPRGVIHVGGKNKIKSIKQLKQYIDSKDPGDAILFQVKYPNTNRIIALEIPK